MQKAFLLTLVILLFTFQIINAQKPQKPNSVEIYNQIKKLNFLGSVLYIAAHPDDENTRLISYLSNETRARTAYLSHTRGDGGQNLIGPQLRESFEHKNSLKLEKLMVENSFFRVPMILVFPKTQKKPCKFGIKKKSSPILFGQSENFNPILSSIGLTIERPELPMATIRHRQC